VARLIDEAASRGAALTSRLLAFARGLPAQPSEVDINALLGETGRLLWPTLGGVEIEVMTAADLPPALAGTGQVTAAVLSLAIAARKRGGPRTVRHECGRRNCLASCLTSCLASCPATGLRCASWLAGR